MLTINGIVIFIFSSGLNEATKEGLDLILMPGLAFDTQLNRLGHGRGYYDTYLHRCALFSKENDLKRPSTSKFFSLYIYLPEISKTILEFTGNFPNTCY